MTPCASAVGLKIECKLGGRSETEKHRLHPVWSEKPGCRLEVHRL